MTGRKNQLSQEGQAYLNFCSLQAGGRAEKRSGWAGSFSLDCCHGPHEWWFQVKCAWHWEGSQDSHDRHARALRVRLYLLKTRVGFHPKGRNNDLLSQRKKRLGLDQTEKILLFFLGTELGLDSELWRWGRCQGRPMEPRPGCRGWVWAWNPDSIQL